MRSIVLDPFGFSLTQAPELRHVDSLGFNYRSVFLGQPRQVFDKICETLPGVRQPHERRTF